MSEPVIETAAPFPGVCVALNASPPRATTEKEVLLGVLEVPRLTLPPALIVTAAALPPPLPPSAAMPPGTLTAPVAEILMGAALPPAVPFELPPRAARLVLVSEPPTISPAVAVGGV